MISPLIRRFRTLASAGGVAAGEPAHGEGVLAAEFDKGRPGCYRSDNSEGSAWGSAGPH